MAQGIRSPAMTGARGMQAVRLMADDPIQQHHLTGMGNQLGDGRMVQRHGSTSSIRDPPIP